MLRCGDRIAQSRRGISGGRWIKNLLRVSIRFEIVVPNSEKKEVIILSKNLPLVASEEIVQRHRDMLTVEDSSL